MLKKLYKWLESIFLVSSSHLATNFQCKKHLQMVMPQDQWLSDSPGAPSLLSGHVSCLRIFLRHDL